LRLLSRKGKDMFKQMKQFEMKESTHKFYNTGSLEFMHGDG